MDNRDETRAKLSSDVWRSADRFMGVACGLIITAAILFLLTFCGFVSSAHAAEHDIPWFVAHPAAREEALRLCANDHRIAQGRRTSAICDNAQAAESRVLAQRRLQGLAVMDTPEWWAENTAFRAAALVACNRRNEADKPLLRYCAPARKSAGLT